MYFIFGIIFHNEDTGTSIVKFDLHCIDADFHIITPSDKDLERFTMHKVTSQLMSDLQDPTRESNDKLPQLYHEVAKT